MRRITISVDDSLAEQFEALIARHGYENRSEAFRDVVRSRLAALRHDHHDLCVSSLQVYLDHDDCLETIVLRGVYAQVSTFADSVITQSGVRHGNIHIVQVDVATPSLAQHRHQHFHPKT